ncbi:MAG: TauD/TfdA dioxygenase family protein [Pikeienuella sp.]
MKITKLTPTIGAEISGLDLSEPLDLATQDTLYQALLDHLVIFIRDQDITPAVHLALAKGFGELSAPHPIYPHVDGHPNIVSLKNDVDHPPDTDGWHTDMTFQEEPPFASVLIARRVPPVGGDTLWCSLYAAYDALPEAMKTLLDDKVAVHDMGDFRNNFASDGGAAITTAHGRFGSAVHPVIGRHPVTGKRFIFANEGFTQHIVGLRAQDSNDLLAMLYRHQNQPEFQVRFKWTEGALAMWDNRVTQHYATADYLPEPREMNRITIVKDRRAGSI